MLVSPPLIKQARKPEPPCLLLLLLIPYSLPFLAAQKTERGTERSSFAVVPPSFLPLRLRPFRLSLFVESLKVFSSARRSCPWPCSECASGQVGQQRGGRRTWYSPYVHFSYARKYLSSKAADADLFCHSASGERRGEKLYSEVGNGSEDENTHVFLLFP